MSDMMSLLAFIGVYAIVGVPAYVAFVVCERSAARNRKAEQTQIEILDELRSLSRAMHSIHEGIIRNGGGR